MRVSLWFEDMIYSKEKLCVVARVIVDAIGEEMLTVHLSRTLHKPSDALSRLACECVPPGL